MKCQDFSAATGQPVWLNCQVLTALILSRQLRKPISMAMDNSTSESFRLYFKALVLGFLHKNFFQMLRPRESHRLTARLKLIVSGLLASNISVKAHHCNACTFYFRWTHF